MAVTYEAGPTGFGLHRELSAAGIRVVAAPSRLQKPSGDRVKTDAKDAVHLARLLRLDEITAVAIPTVDQEAARDLVRAREDCRGDLMRARTGCRTAAATRNRLLRRPGLDREARRLAATPGTTAAGQPCDPADLRLRLRERPDGQSSPGPARHRDRRDGRGLPVHRHGAPTRCLRGVSTLTGFALAVEIGDWHRFTGNTIGSFVGLVPSEYSSGSSRVQGSITKTGNTHVRRLLVEAAWHHRARYTVGKTMRDRWDLAPAAARARGDEGNRRLHQRWVKFIERKKKPTIANVAIARELAGWCWSLAVLEE